MHQAHGSRSFANGRGHPLDTSRPDIAYCEHSWQAALEHERRPRKRPRRIPNRVNGLWQIAAGEDKALLIQSDTASQPIGVRRGGGYDEEVDTESSFSMVANKAKSLIELFKSIYVLGKWARNGLFGQCRFQCSIKLTTARIAE